MSHPNPPGSYPPDPYSSGPYAPGPRRFERSRSDRFLGGVCGGAAKYLGLDPTLVRILTAVLALAFGVTVIAYVVLLFVLPEEGSPRPPQVPPYHGDGGAPTGRGWGADQTWGTGRPPEADPVWGHGGAPWEQPQNPPRTRPDDLR